MNTAQKKTAHPSTAKTCSRQQPSAPKGEATGGAAAHTNLQQASALRIGPGEERPQPQPQRRPPLRQPGVQHQLSQQRHHLGGQGYPRLRVRVARATAFVGASPTASCYTVWVCSGGGGANGVGCPPSTRGCLFACAWGGGCSGFLVLLNKAGKLLEISAQTWFV